MVVTIIDFEISITINVICTSCGTSGRANSLIRADVSVVATGRYENRARDLSAMEFIDHQSLESITDRVEIIDPPEPWMHVSNWDRKSSISDDGKDEDGSWCHCLFLLVPRTA